MQQALSIILILMLCLSFVACKNDNEPTADIPNSNPAVSIENTNESTVDSNMTSVENKIDNMSETAIASNLESITIQPNNKYEQNGRVFDIFDIDTAKIASVKLFDGNTGKNATVTDGETIQKIVDDFGSTELIFELHQTEASVGFSTLVDFYDAQGNRLLHFDVNNETFCYPEAIDSKYIYKYNGDPIDVAYLISLTQ